MNPMSQAANDESTSGAALTSAESSAQSASQTLQPDLGEASDSYEVKIVALEEQVQCLRRDLREEWIRFGQSFEPRRTTEGPAAFWLGLTALAGLLLLAAWMLRPQTADPELLANDAAVRLEAILQRAGAQREAGDLRNSAHTLTEAIALAPADGRAWLQRGKLRFEMEDFGGAESDLTAAIERLPHSADAFVWRGNARQRQRQYSGATSDFSRAIELNPDSDLGYYNRALAEFEQRHFDAAIADATLAVKRNPDDPANLALRAKAYLGGGQQAAALADLDEAIRRNERDISSRFYRGVLYLESRRVSEGLADLAAAIDGDPVQTARLARKYRHNASLQATVSR